MSLAELTLQVMKTKGDANQSFMKTWPSGQTNVRLNPTGGADFRSRNEKLQKSVSGKNYTLWSYSNIGYIKLSFNGKIFNFWWWKQMHESLIDWFLIHLKVPTILITSNSKKRFWVDFINSSWTTNFMTKGSSKSTVVPSPGSPCSSWVTLLTTPHLSTTSFSMSTRMW